MIRSIRSFMAPIFVAAAMTAPSLDAQAQPSTPPFEVVSVKRNSSGSLQRRLGALPGGRFTAVNVTTMQLIQWAYQLPPSRIANATGWVTSEQFDVEARAAGDVPPPRVRQMVRQLLADRFGLVVREQQREVAVFILGPERNDSRLGPQLRPADPMCKETGRPPVVDGGALTGMFDADLHWTWTPEQILDQPIGTTPVQIDPSGISLQAALAEQLGLRLQRERRALDVLVIERIARPTVD